MIKKTDYFYINICKTASLPILTLYLLDLPNGIFAEMFKYILKP